VTTSPLDSNDLRLRIQGTLDQFLSQHRELMASVSVDTLPLVDSLTTLVSGGKRLRPAFAYWGYRANGSQDSDGVVKAATSLEFLQACALIHDDVMDNSDTRRGNPATHKQFEALHHDNEWHSDSAKFGEGAAILIGDLALSWADELLLTSGLDTDQLTSAKSVYDIMRTELMAGQYLDLLEQVRRDISEDRAMKVIRYKSAKYTIERPLLMGAAIAEASPEVQDALSNYGLELGTAFQLRDDVLGVFGDAQVTGKPAGDDLRERKQTLLVAGSESRIEFEVLFAQPELTDADIAKLQTIISESGALESVEQTISQTTDSALNALTNESIDSTARQALTDLAFMATQRAS
jgi:geranylgeranyl diphosphate synthase type I